MNFDSRGLLMCARYSFAPNLFHYCGPQKQVNLREYITTGSTDQGLTEILEQFDTLYKYLEMIALQNKLQDPFAARVVEAYWLGNNLLNKSKFRPFASHLTDTLQLQKSLPKKHLHRLLEKLDTGVAQHTFHVLNIFRRTGHQAIPHTLSTMDNCRISWGKVKKIKHEEDTAVEILVEVAALIYEKDKLSLGLPTVKNVLSLGFSPKLGEWVSIHWGYVCQVLTGVQVTNLKYYTELAINLANRQ